jgi:hypothetical protein
MWDLILLESRDDYESNVRDASLIKKNATKKR